MTHDVYCTYAGYPSDMIDRALEAKAEALDCSEFLGAGYGGCERDLQFRFEAYDSARYFVRLCRKDARLDQVTYSIKTKRGEEYDG